MKSSGVIFKPYFTQKGTGPHLGEAVLALDANGDVFRAEIEINRQGVAIKNVKGRFSVMVRWNVQGYGYLFMPVDNGGTLYACPADGQQKFNLAFELAKSRLSRNRQRLSQFEMQGWQATSEIHGLIDLAANLFDDARRALADPFTCAQWSQKALLYALQAGELLEIEKARADVLKRGYRADFLYGCDSRGYFQMNKNLFMTRFSELFNYATITHYLIGDHVNFEEQEGRRMFKERDEVCNRLIDHNITIEGRPLYWTHTWVTPQWLKSKTYNQLKIYLEKHIRETITHYGDRIKVWEVVNEMHDWANETELNHEQTIDLTKFACQVARDTNPHIKLLVNNCCPFADYVQKGRWHDRPARYPQRTPHQFTRQLVEAGADFDLLGIQVYFVKRTFMETVAYIERYHEFGKKLQLAEVGASSLGVTEEFTVKESPSFSQQPCEWQRHWDEELQADWLEYIFTVAYSKAYIEAANWYDFIDGHSFLNNGGLLRSAKGEKKAAFYRLKNLQEKWQKMANS